MINTEHFPSAEDMAMGQRHLSSLSKHINGAEEKSILDSITSPDEIALLGFVRRISKRLLTLEETAAFLLDPTDFALFKEFVARRKAALALGGNA